MIGATLLRLNHPVLSILDSLAELAPHTILVLEQELFGQFGSIEHHLEPIFLGYLGAWHIQTGVE